MNPRPKTPLVLSFLPQTVLLSWIMSLSVGSSAAVEPENGLLDDPKVHCGVLVNIPELTESSGLAASNRRPGLFWSHNDSGGEPELFAFDQFGKRTGHCRLNGTAAIDWEDMASFVADGKAHLIVADCGDNEARRNSISLYLLEEPDPCETTELSHLTKLVVRFPDGRENCEAVAVDPVRKQIVLIAKTSFWRAGVYTLPLSVADHAKRETKSVIATRVGGLTLPMISAMDIDPGTGDVWIANYFQTFLFRCNDVPRTDYSCTNRRRTLSKQLAALPESFELPRWKQIEAIAVDHHRRVWITSEGSPTPLGNLRVERERKSTEK